MLILVSCLFISISSSSQSAPSYKIEKLPSSINSAYEETKPISSQNGDTLFFIRSGFPGNKGGKYADEDIWFTSWCDDKSWQDPTNKFGKINNVRANIFAGLGSKSETIYLFDYTVSGNRRQIGISAYDITSGEVVKEILGSDHRIDIDDDFHDLYLHPNEEVLLISMRSINTLGLEDIYISTKDSSEIWSKPLNLGAAINSRGFEISPFLSDDGTVLFFASDRQGGLGDADIYYSYRQDENWSNWSTPKNMGQPFNSSKFDAYLSKNGKGAFYIASNRSSEYSDIYKISVLETNALAQVAPVDDPESFHAQESILTDSESPPENLTLYFNFDKANLSLKESNKLNGFISEKLKNRIGFQIRILGFTDDTGTESYNYRLSTKRAKAIAKIIRKAGFGMNIIEVSGKGIYPSHEGLIPKPEQEMRRVEIFVETIE